MVVAGDGTSGRWKRRDRLATADVLRISDASSGEDAATLYDGDGVE